MSDTKALTIADDALDMIRQLRDQEPGDGEFALSIEVTGFRGPQFSYELAFVELATKKEDWSEERHGDMAVIFPEVDREKLDGSALELTDQGLVMNNPNSPAPPEMSAPAGDLEGPLVEQVQQVITQQVNPAIASHGGGAELVSVDGTIAYLRLFRWLSRLRSCSSDAQAGERADIARIDRRADPSGRCDRPCIGRRPLLPE